MSIEFTTKEAFAKEFLPYFFAMRSVAEKGGASATRILAVRSDLWYPGFILRWIYARLNLKLPELPREIIWTREILQEIGIETTLQIKTPFLIPGAEEPNLSVDVTAHWGPGKAWFTYSVARVECYNTNSRRSLPRHYTKYMDTVGTRTVLDSMKG